MLANALVCEDLGRIHSRFSKTEFFLDTPIILRLLGLLGPSREAVAAQILSLVRKLGGSIAVFEHTVEEVERVLAACEHQFDNPRARGNIIAIMRETGRSKSDLVLLRGQLRRKLTKLDILCRPTPRYDAPFQIDESMLEGTLDEEIRYYNDRALLDDIQSIRSVYALRRGRRPQHLEEAIAMLVTPNAALARAAYKHGRSQEDPNEVSTVITDLSLGGVAWLKAPQGAPDLPETEVLALCYAALEPPPGLWSKYLEEIDRLRRSGVDLPIDLDFLRFDTVAKRELMNLTLGSEDEFTVETVRQVAERVHAELEREHDSRLQQERAQHAVVLEGEHARYESLRQERDSLAQTTDAAREKLYWTVERIGRLIGSSVSILLAVILVILIALSTYFTMQRTNNPNYGYAGAVTILLALWWAYTGVSGFSIKQIGDSVGKSAQRLVFRLLAPIAPKPRAQKSDNEMADRIRT